MHFDADAMIQPSPEHLRGPGLLESIGWTAAYLVTQAVTALLLVVFLVLCAFDGWPARPAVIGEILGSMGRVEFTWLSVYVTGGATLGALFVLVPAAGWRLGPRPRVALGVHSPGARQLILLAGVVLPLAILSDEVYRAALLAWEAARERLAQNWPMLGRFGDVDTMDLIRNQTADTAYPLLLVIVGVGPAIGEELIFRGLIGRGLVNRFGTIGGVLVTSVLFAAAHGTPAHAVATVPLAIFLHLTYLATRTIWAPILLHFLNNALSVTMLKYGLGENVSASPAMLVSAMVYVVAVGVLLWQTRPGGKIGRTESRRAFPTWSVLDVGPGASGRLLPRWLTLAATAGVVGFTWTFVAAAMAGS